MRRIILITSTYERPQRIRCIQRCISMFRKVPDLLWLIVEDGSALCPDVESLLMKSGIDYRYLSIGPTRDFGNVQRDLALKYISAEKLDGVVYIADDDNYYENVLFEEIRRTKRVSVFPVGNLGPHGIERPIVRQGKIVGWDADWLERKYPVDMAGYAFDSQVLQALKPPLWAYVGRGGESEFLEKFVKSADEFELLCNDCRQCWAWHNHSLHFSRLRARMKFVYFNLRRLYRLKIKSMSKA